MARTKSDVDRLQRQSNAADTATPDHEPDDMDVDSPPCVPALRSLAVDPNLPSTDAASDSDNDADMSDPTVFADDLADDATQEQAQALLGERSKRQTLFASMFADVGAASSLSAGQSAAATSSIPKPRGKRMRRPNHDDEDFDPAQHAPLRRSTRSRNASSYDDDDFDSDFEGGGKPKKRKTNRPNGNVHDFDRSEQMRTFKTTSDVSHLKLPYARVPDPYPTAANRPFGHIPGVPVGSLFYFRQDVHHAGIHRGFVAGIFGHEQFGCWSICVNGGYPEDIDEGDRIVFTGSGGRELKEKNLRTADQSCDQSVSNRCNASLIKSHATGHPIRVVRGPKSHSPYTPEGAYRYDGTYKCTNWEFATGKTGFRVLRFTLERLPDQTPLADLPTSFDDERWVAIRDEVLAFRGMTVEQLQAQAQAADSQVGQMKEAKQGGPARAVSADDRPKRAARTGKGKAESESESQSDSDVDVDDAVVELAPQPPPVKGKGKAKSKPAASPNVTSVVAQPTRQSARQAASAASSAGTAKPLPTRSSARLKSTPVSFSIESSSEPDDDGLSDVANADTLDDPPATLPARVTRQGTRFAIEVPLPPPPRNAHLLVRKRKQIAQAVPLDPPSSLFTPDDWTSMAREDQVAVIAQWKPPAERVFVHPFELQAMSEHERRELQLVDRVGNGGRPEQRDWECETPVNNGEDDGAEEDLTPRASALAALGVGTAFVDSGLPSSEASPVRKNNEESEDSEEPLRWDGVAPGEAVRIGSLAAVPDSGFGDEGAGMV